MIMRIVSAAVVAFVVGLLCLLLGLLLPLLQAPFAVVVGGFLTNWAWALGVAAGLWHFAQGGGFNFQWPRPPGPPPQQ